MMSAVVGRPDPVLCHSEDRTNLRFKISLNLAFKMSIEVDDFEHKAQSVFFVFFCKRYKFKDYTQ